jgi:hypothetical protein
MCWFVLLPSTSRQQSIQLRVVVGEWNAWGDLLCLLTETRKLSAQPLAKAALEGAARDHRKRRNTRFNLRCWQYIYAWFGVKVLNPTVVPKKDHQQ